MKNVNDLIRWHKSHLSRMQKLMGISHYSQLWYAFGKGLFIGIILCVLLSGCTTVKSTTIISQERKQELGAIGKTLGCVFAPASPECEKLKRESKASQDELNKEFDEIK